MKIFQGLNRSQGMTIVLVTHSDEMAAYATRIITFLDGSIVSDNPAGNPERPPEKLSTSRIFAELHS